MNEHNDNLEEKKNILQEDESFPWLFTIISVFLLGVLLIIIYLVVSPSKAGESSYANNTENNTTEVLDENTGDNIDNYESPYKLQNIYEGKNWTGDIALVNEKNEKIIESLNKLFPILVKDPKQYIELFAVPENTDYVVFELKVADTNGLLYKVNIKDNTLVRLSANKIYTNKSSKNYLSPDQHHLIMANIDDYDGNENVIYVIDLLTGLYKEYKLANNETYNAAWSYDNNFVRISWIDNNKFKVAIFDQSKKIKRPKVLVSPVELSEDDLNKIYIEEREFVLE